MKRFSEMTQNELEVEIARLEQSIKESEWEAEREVHRQRWLMARSYAVRHRPFPPGFYRIDEEGGRFRLSYVNGVMAWGTGEDGEERALPLAVLQPEEQE